MLLAVRRFISYNIKLLKAVVVSPHEEESLQYLCANDGTTVASLYLKKTMGPL